MVISFQSQLGRILSPLRNWCAKAHDVKRSGDIFGHLKKFSYRIILIESIQTFLPELGFNQFIKTMTTKMKRMRFRLSYLPSIEKICVENQCALAQSKVIVPAVRPGLDR